MLSVIDVATPQKYLDFTAPLADGYRACYVKQGGDNNPRYIAPNYTAQVDRARSLGYRIGHYWVPEDSMDPVGAADYVVANLRNWAPTDFIVLDNESYPGNDPDGSGPQTDSIMYSDAQAAAWVERVKLKRGIPGNQVLVYYGLSDARSRTHSAVLATGASFIIAAYDYAPFTFATPSNIPASRIVGHQTGGRIWPTTTGGTVAVDVNSFIDTAFDYAPILPIELEQDMSILIKSPNRPWLLIDAGFGQLVVDAHVPTIKKTVSKVLDTINDAEYDITKANYVKPVVTSAIDSNALATAVADKVIPAVVAAVVAEIPDATVVDEESIAAKVRAKFTEQPLSVLQSPIVAG